MKPASPRPVRIHGAQDQCAKPVALRGFGYRDLTMFHFRFSHDTPRAVPALVRCDGPARASRGDNKCQMNPAAAIEVQCPTEDLDLRRTNPNDASEATPRISGHAHCHRHPTRLDHFRHRTVEHQIIRGNTNNLTGEGRCGGPPRSRTTEDHDSDVSPERWDTAATAIETQRHRSGISPFDGPFEGDTLFERAVGTITDAIDALTIERAIDPTSTGQKTRPAMAAEDWAGSNHFLWTATADQHRQVWRDAYLG